MPVTLRPIQPEDEPFLHAVYASTRLDELAPLGWTAEQVDAFLTMQFTAQHTHYQKYYPKAAYQLILLDGQPIGRLYVDRWADELRIIDIALLPTHRSQGIGGALLRQILAEGEQAALPVRIHVERYNPALRLYERLGFQPVGETGVYLLMERLPPTNPPAP